MKKKLFFLTASALSVLLIGQTVSATMFTIKFSAEDVKIGGTTPIELMSQFDYYPIRYTVDGSDPSEGEEVPDGGIHLEPGAYKLKAGVFTDDGEAISDTYTRFYVSGVSSRAVQTDQTRITYNDYDEPNKRYPYYMFDGDTALGLINKCWTVASMPVTVSYDEPITADMGVITAKVSNKALSWFDGSKNSSGTTATQKEKTTDELFLTLDISYKTESGDYQSVLGGGRKIVLPKGTEVTYKFADGRADVWVTFAFDIGKFTSDEIRFDFLADKNLSSIKEFELFQSVGKTYKVHYSTTTGKLQNGASIELTGNTQKQTIRYTTDGTVPTGSSEVYEAPIFPAEDSITTLKAAIFDENDERVSEVYENTYVVGSLTAVGVQTDTSKVTASGATAAARARYAVDGDKALENPQVTTMSLDRSQYPAAAVLEVEYDEPITVDTLLALVTVNEKEYFENVSNGAEGKNSDGNRGVKTETFVKDLDVDFKVDYIKDGETEFTEGEWKTVTLTAGSTGIWTYTNGYGRGWAYLPAVRFEGATVTKIRISIRNFAESASLAKLWHIKELELYSSGN